MNGYIMRPTFDYKNDTNKPIRAGGVIIYRKFNNEIELLLIKKLNRYEDIGGKTDIKDINEFDTVSREVKEETNFVINQKIIKKQLDNNKSIYNYKSKYVLYFVKANKYERKLTSEKFGECENFDSIERTIHWVNIKLILNDELILHPRLYCMYNDLKANIIKLF